MSELILFVLWLVLLLFEALGPFARVAGVEMGNSAMGLVVQSQISLISRIFAYTFALFFGYLADKGIAKHALSSPLAWMLFFCFPFAFLALWSLRYYFLDLFRRVVKLNLTQSLRPSFAQLVLGCWQLFFSRKCILANPLSLLRLQASYSLRFKLIYVISFALFYLSWPAAIFLVSVNPSSRSFISSFPTLLVSLNTMLTSLIFDPRLVSDEKSSNYFYLLKLRLYSAVSLPIAWLLVPLF